MANYPYYGNNFQPNFQPGFNGQQGFQPNFQPEPKQPEIICLPVSSRTEADAYIVTANGPAVVMLDIPHNAIYYKRFNINTGAADFVSFSRDAEVAPPDYGALLNNASQLLLGMDKKIDGLLEAMEKPKKKTEKEG